MLDRLLARPPPEPPPNVPALDAASPNSEKLTLKQKLALHLSSSACASCHEKFDPFGVTFEHYDAVGIWHETRKLVGSTVETVDARGAGLQLRRGDGVQRRGPAVGGRDIDALQGRKRVAGRAVGLGGRPPYADGVAVAIGVAKPAGLLARKRPASVSKARWSGMIKWFQARQRDGDLEKALESKWY